MLKEYSYALIALLKGIVYDHQKDNWANLLQYEAEVKKYFAAIGLELFLDKSEGYAYLKQAAFVDDMEIPRLSEKRQLNFYMSVLCLTLRKYLLEHDAQGGSVRVVISKQEIINRVTMFMPRAIDEAKQQDKIVATINKLTDQTGFLRELKDNTDNFEIHRIIKGFINADEIDDTLRRLEQYAMEKQSID